MLCVAWPGCPQGCLVRCSAGYTGGGEWPGIFSVPPPRAFRAQHWGPAKMGKACPKQATTFSPCALQPESLFHRFLVLRGWTPMQVPASQHTHTPFLEGLAGAAGVVLLWLPRPPGVSQACIEFSPHTRHLQACSGKKEPVFLELLACPLPTAQAPAGANCARRASSVYLWITGNSGQATPGSLQPGKERERSSSQHGRGRCASLKGWLFLRPQPLPASDPGLPFLSQDDFRIAWKLWRRTAWCESQLHPVLSLGSLSVPICKMEMVGG